MQKFKRPRIFSDRDSVNKINSEAKNIYLAMLNSGHGKLDKNNKVQFCGMVHHPEDGIAVFLPRESKTGTSDCDFETARLTMKALARFSIETSNRQFQDDGETGNPELLSVIKKLSDDFVKNGLFFERLRNETLNSGKANWGKTIKRELPMPNKFKQPIFTNIHTSRSSRSHDTLLAQIQAAVIKEIHQAHSWWLDSISGRISELSSCIRPQFPRSIWANKLDSLMPSLYSSRSIFLANYLRYYLRKTRTSSDGSFVFGLNDFHTVWETILKKTIERSPYDRMEKWNSKLPIPVYSKKDNSEQESKLKGMQTDIILEDEIGYTIIDAKYYSAKTANTAPGWSDIVKQFFYEKALREIVDSPEKVPSKIQNIFIFPSKTNDGPLTHVALQNRDLNEAVSDYFPPISCMYVSVRRALELYVSRKQGITVPNKIKVSSDTH